MLVLNPQQLSIKNSSTAIVRLHRRQMTVLVRLDLQVIRDHPRPIAAPKDASAGKQAAQPIAATMVPTDPSFSNIFDTVIYLNWIRLHLELGFKGTE